MIDLIIPHGLNSGALSEAQGEVECYGTLPGLSLTGFVCGWNEFVIFLLGLGRV